MMGRSRKQVSFRELHLWANGPVVDPDSFYGKMAEYGPSLVREEWFADLYSDRGRPSVSPVLLTKVMLLMFHDNVSDRQAEEHARYDLRWKAALELGIDETGFDATALCRFRARLLLHERDREVFRRTIEAAREHGLISAEAAEVVDSTPVLGAGAVQDTYTLIRSAIRKMVRTIRSHPGTATDLEKALERDDYDEQGKPEIDWADPEARRELLNQIVRDARTMVAATEGLDLTAAEQEARELLSAVTEQDIAEREDGTVEIKQGVAKDRVISTTDPEMRHGHKSSKGKFDGHKAHIMEDTESGIITAVAVTAGNVPDAVALPELLDQQAKAGVTPSEVIGDTAYGSGATRAEMAERQVRLVAPVPPEVRGECFPKSAFEIELLAGTCKCPAGRVAGVKRGIAPGQEDSFQFGKVCRDCPLRSQCTRSRRGRIVRVNAQEALLNEGRAFQRTEPFKEAYRQRPAVERKIADLVRHGMRKARYIGKARTRLQLAWTAAVVNLRVLFKRMPEGALCPI